MHPAHHPRRPRASPLWQLIHHTWEELLSIYETDHRPVMGPLRPETIAHVQDYLRCGDLAAGFTRYHCPDCGHQHLLAFTCKSRHFCPACHQRRTLHTGTWIANSVCHPVPHRQFVLTPSPRSVGPRGPGLRPVCLARPRRLGSPSPKSSAASSANGATSSYISSKPPSTPCATPSAPGSISP